MFYAECLEVFCGKSTYPLSIQTMATSKWQSASSFPVLFHYINVECDMREEEIITDVY